MPPISASPYFIFNDWSFNCREDEAATRALENKRTDACLVPCPEEPGMHHLFPTQGTHGATVLVMAP